MFEDIQKIMMTKNVMQDDKTLTKNKTKKVSLTNLL